MTSKKTTIAAAVAVAIGGGFAADADAAAIVSMTIEATSLDGRAGAFAFAPPGSTAYTNFFTSDLGPIVADGLPQANQLGNGFTSGFTFFGSPFEPNTLDALGPSGPTGGGTGDFNPSPAGGIQGDITGGVLSFSEFNWAGTFNNFALFPLSPDGPFVSLQVGAEVAPNQFEYLVRWEHFIEPQSGFSGDSIWQIEGIATVESAAVVPIPAAAWLMGSGLVGLAAVARRRKKKDEESAA